MKKILLLIICCLGLVSCEYDYKNVLYKNAYYAVAKVNDSIVAIIPSQYGLKEEGVKFVNIKYINNENFIVVKE